MVEPSWKLLRLERNLLADEPQDPVVAQSAFMLYGMIHARFIVTARGLEAMVGTKEL